MATWWPFGRKKKSPQRMFVPDNGMWKPGGDRSLEGSEGIFSAVTRLSSVLASAPFRLYKDGKEVQNHYISRLMMYEAAPGVTPYLYKSTLETCRNVHGNGYALKVPGLDGRVERLDIIDPDKVEPMREQETGEVWYRLRPGNGVEFMIHYREMIHVKHVSAGGMKGVNPITVLTDALDYDDQMKAFSLQALKGINSCVTLEFPSNLGKEQKDMIIQDFISNYQASSGGLIVLSGGVKANVIAKSPVDSKVLDVERVTKGRIAAVYTLPPHMLGNFDHASYGSNEQQMLELLQLTMRATFQQYADEHTLKLLTYNEVQQGYRLAFDEEQMLIPTSIEKAQMAQYYVRNAIRTPNELRREAGLPDVDGGNSLMASRDLAPVDYLVNNPGAASAVK